MFRSSKSYFFHLLTYYVILTIVILKTSTPLYAIPNYIFQIDINRNGNNFPLYNVPYLKSGDKIILSINDPLDNNEKLSFQQSTYNKVPISSGTIEVNNNDHVIPVIYFKSPRRPDIQFQIGSLGENMQSIEFLVPADKLQSYIIFIHVKDNHNDIREAINKVSSVIGNSLDPLRIQDDKLNRTNLFYTTICKIVTKYDQNLKTPNQTADPKLIAKKTLAELKITLPVGSDPEQYITDAQNIFNRINSANTEDLDIVINNFIDIIPKLKFNYFNFDVGKFLVHIIAQSFRNGNRPTYEYKACVGQINDDNSIIMDHGDFQSDNKKNPYISS